MTSTSSSVTVPCLSREDITNSHHVRLELDYMDTVTFTWGWTMVARHCLVNPLSLLSTNVVGHFCTFYSTYARYMVTGPLLLLLS